MPIPSITFYTANPTFDEGQEFARYLDEAAEGFFRFMLGRRSVDIIAKAFTEPEHDLSYQNVTFAEYERAIVGMVSGYTAEQHRRSSEKPLNQAAGRLNFRKMVVSMLFSPLLNVIDTIADGDYYLQGIAVDKELRGNGVGKILLDHIENRARTCGSSRLALDVSASNEGACKLYERRGMTVESQWPRRLTIPRLKFFRMVKSL